MTFDVLEIIAGLEDAFWGVLQPNNISEPTAIRARTTSPARGLFGSFSSRSLFVLWKDLYNGLSGARHTAWKNYWITLPFSSHLGAGGYPGSGYSAFIYVNAPRYQAGLDLLLDPPLPLGPELVLNPDFYLNADEWTLDGGIWEDGGIRIDSVDDFYYCNVMQDFGATLENGLYRVSVVVNIPAGLTGALGGGSIPGGTVFAGGIGTDSGSNFYLGVFVNSSGGLTLEYTADVNYNNDPADNGFIFRVEANGDEGPIFIYSVSLKKHL